MGQEVRMFDSIQQAIECLGFSAVTEMLQTKEMVWNGEFWMMKEV